MTGIVAYIGSLIIKDRLYSGRSGISIRKGVVELVTSPNVGVSSGLVGGVVLILEAMVVVVGARAFLH